MAGNVVLPPAGAAPPPVSRSSKLPAPSPAPAAATPAPGTTPGSAPPQPSHAAAEAPPPPRPGRRAAPAAGEPDTVINTLSTPAIPPERSPPKVFLT